MICKDCKKDIEVTLAEMKFFIENHEPYQCESCMDKNKKQVTANASNPSIARVNNPPTNRQSARSGKNFFLNPYNFVRHYSQNNMKNSGQLPHRAQPPSHDRYIGLSGTVKCTADVKTPLFISDAHDITVENEHKTYKFFNSPDGKKIIPASSLKGMIRNIYETITGSCMVIFDDKRLSYRDSSISSRLVPARVETEGGIFYLRMLPGTTEFGRTQGALSYAAWIPQYPPRSNTPILTSGKEYWALLEKFEHPTKPIRCWRVISIAEDEKNVKKSKQNGDFVTKGWAYITNKNIENKHDERFFFRCDKLFGDKDNQVNERLPEKIKLDNNLKNELWQNWRTLITEYQTRHADEVKFRETAKISLNAPYNNQMAFSPFITDESTRELKHGDLVYVQIEGALPNLRIRNLLPLAVPRILHKNSIKEMLPPSLEVEKCSEYEALCPACRLFGWVKDNEEQKSKQLADKKISHTAYKGRIRISNGTVNKDVRYENKLSAADNNKMCLNTLGTPKPTTGRFYLLNRQSKKIRPTENALYDNSCNVLRGRKLYLHHNNFAPREAIRTTADKFNRTVEGCLGKGSDFEFDVAFENLSSAELGGLLWCLELGECFHRLGYAKPLGLGSIKISVNEVATWDFSERYSNFSPGGKLIVTEEKRQDWVDEFKKEIVAKFNGKSGSFDDLEIVREIKAILNNKSPHNVHYPRPSQNALADGRNFEWFVGNNRTGKNGGPHISLPLATERDNEDMLYVINKRGVQT